MVDSTRQEAMLKELFDSQRLGVLSTHSGGQPYANLVAFAATSDLREILFATTRSTRKFANLTADSRVALLVDNRANEPADVHSAMAVTATGRVEEVPADQQEHYLRLYLAKHPHLRDFVASPSCALLRIRVKTFYLVHRFQQVTEIHAPS